MKKEIVNEIFIIRSIACLSIVLLHTLMSGIKKIPDTNGTLIDITTGTSMILLFGTPVFVFISEFLLAKSYSTSIPKNFLSKRAKFLLIPYAIMGIFYAAIELDNFTLRGFLIHSLRNILFADYTGYFIVIIFQFYILHKVFYKYLSNVPAKKMLIISFIINVLYLAFFNFIPPLNFIPHALYLWDTFSWIPFIGWIFYFVLGYYCGKNIQLFRMFNQKYKYFIFIGTLVSLSIVLIMKELGLPEVVSSKRVDVLIFTSFMIPLLFYLSSKIKNVPSFIVVISNYSFNIYLLHKIFIHYLEKLPVDNVFLYVIFMFSISIGSSMLAAKLINILPFGKYIVGNTTKFKSSYYKSDVV